MLKTHKSGEVIMPAAERHDSKYWSYVECSFPMSPVAIFEARASGGGEPIVRIAASQIAYPIDCTYDAGCEILRLYAFIPRAIDGGDPIIEEISELWEVDNGSDKEWGLLFIARSGKQYTHESGGGTSSDKPELSHRVRRIFPRSSDTKRPGCN